MGKVIRLRTNKRRGDGIGTILAAMGLAGAAGYFGPGLLSRISMPSITQAVTSSANEIIIGTASVVDGDTIEIHGERIRFSGVDAPESNQLCEDGGGREYRCGAKSANALSEWLAASSPTRCEFVDRDQYGRFVGNCFRADRTSVQKWLVGNGYAMDWPRYSNGTFSSEQSGAKANHKGIWQGDFQPPWKWRAAQRNQRNSSIAPLVSTSSSSGSCDIKGNVSRRGKRIYHVPGQEWYTRTRISASKGERWFCSEQEARAAGWRRAKR